MLWMDENVSQQSNEKSLTHTNHLLHILKYNTLKVVHLGTLLSSSREGIHYFTHTKVVHTNMIAHKIVFVATNSKRVLQIRSSGHKQSTL